MFLEDIINSNNRILLTVLLMLEDASDRYIITTLINKYPNYKVNIEIDDQPDWLVDYRIREWNVNRMSKVIYIHIEEYVI